MVVIPPVAVVPMPVIVPVIVPVVPNIIMMVVTPVVPAIVIWNMIGAMVCPIPRLPLFTSATLTWAIRTIAITRTTWAVTVFSWPSRSIAAVAWASGAIVVAGASRFC